MPNDHGPQAARKRRGDGERSRGAIVAEASRLATVEGFEGLSIARLADAVGMSKSGLFAHFGSKEELQLATIDAATGLFTDEVLAPAEDAPDGLERLRRLYGSYLRYLENEIFPGGCFFASALAEVNTRPGPVRDRLVTFFGDWLGELDRAVRDAQTEGAIDPREDAAQLAFEIEAALLLANAQYVLARTHEPIKRAEDAIQRRLASAESPRRPARRAPRRAPRRA
jgi:AcrR family transcriptional regulator